MNTEIIVNNQSLELTEDLSMAFTYSISDIRQPEKRQTDFSKTITIPATKQNNQIFSHIYKIDKLINTTNYNVNFTPEFNPNLKATAKVYIDGINVFDGVIQLLNINILDNTNINYEVCLFGKLSNIFYNLGEDYLTNLDLSEYDHAYSRTNQVNSWATSIKKNGSNYVNFSGGNPTGEGYVYPLADYGYNNGLTYKVNQLFPAIYAKTYIDKIFNYAGFDYTSSFFDSNFFKRLIIPYNKFKTSMSQDELNARKFYVTDALYDNAYSPIYTNVTSRTDSGLIYWQNETTSPAFDNYNLYDNAKFTPTQSGYYNLKSLINSDLSIYFIQANLAGAGVSATSGSGTINFYVDIIKYDSTTSTESSLGQLTTTLNLASDITYPITDGSQRAGFKTINSTGLNQNNVFLRAGDYIKFSYTVTYSSAYVNYYISAQAINFLGSFQVTLNESGISTQSYFYDEPINTSISEDSTFYLNKAIPVNVKQKDFFTSIIKMFNLYVDVDPENEFNLLIEPRNDFYNTDVIDWTYKLDTASNFQINPMGDLENKRYVFTYKEDSDHYNTVYKNNNNNRIYGDVIFEVNNDFVKDINKNEVIFSPTPAVGSSLHNRVIPTFLKYDSNNINTNITAITQKEGMDSNIRILYYSGLKSCGTWYLNSDIYSNASYTSYPYANHLDDPAASTLDLNFGVPMQIFFQTSFYTSHTLYNVYWSDLMGSITDPDSKIVTCYMNLKPTDILQLSFKKLYLIDGNYYRLNKIFDYDPLSVKVTKVEFLKVKKAVAFSGQGSTILPIVTTYNLVEGGLNEVRDLGATSFYNLIEGGEDEVRNIAATSFYNLVNSGLNTI
jgi:hypothetical protein